MDETVYKIALAGFLHDIGKFAERAEMPLDTNTRDDNAALFQPQYNGRYSHKHVLYTAGFIEKYKDLFPKQLHEVKDRDDESLLMLAARHHNPSTPTDWIITIADRISSGFDRDTFKESDETIYYREFKKTRLLPILEGLRKDGSWPADSPDSFRNRYELKEISPLSIFPAPKWSNKDSDYAEPFKNFTEALKNLQHRENIELWFEHFDSLFLITSSHIPAATVGDVVYDVSLYDHCKTTSAIASALYQYHKDKNTLNEQSVKSLDDKKIMLVTGDFYGIQKFIFSEGGSTGKATAKLLRGRSFAVSLITELAADMLCRELGLLGVSIVLNAAGKFTILAANTDKTDAAVKSVSEKINKWLIEHFFGEVSFGFSSIAASCNDFTAAKFPDLLERLQKSSEEKKYRKFDITLYGGTVKSYIDAFDNTLEKPLCPFCGKRPASPSAYVNISSQRECACPVCHDHIYIGEHLAKKRLVAITTIDADLKQDKLLSPIFGKYQISFDVSGMLSELSRNRTLIKYWDISISSDESITKEITAKFFNSYVPKYGDDDLQDDRYFAGRKSEKKQLEMIDQIKTGIPKTFSDLAVKALNFTDRPNKFEGIEALGILKADVDDLGLLFACGLRPGRQTISRLATMSRQMNNFFCIYLPYLLGKDETFNNIYTVFAGGDDLFLIGPWNRIIDFAGRLHSEFNKYVCGNKHITISAGIAVCKPNDPVSSVSEKAGMALKASKSAANGERDRITLFGETVTWAEFYELQEIRNTLKRWLEGGIINNAMLFRLNELLEMRKQEKEIVASGKVHIEDMECLKWRARLKYSIVRNIGKGLKGEAKENAINEVMKTAQWLDTYGGALKIPLWQIIYNRR